MRITSMGQVTIPQSIREKAGLLPNTEVEFIYERGVVLLVKVEAPSPGTRGEEVLRRLAGSAVTSGLSTDEILAHMRGPR